MLTGGLLPFPRTGCVLYAKEILSCCCEIRHVVCGTEDEAPAAGFSGPHVMMT